MKTVRYGTFETNSSSTHEATFKCALRDIKEFPLPDEKGCLTIRLDRSKLTLSRWGSWNEYVTYYDFLILALVFATDGHKITECCSISDGDQKLLLKWINGTYRMVGLPPVKRVRLVLDMFIDAMPDGSGEDPTSDDPTDVVQFFQGEQNLTRFLCDLGCEVRAAVFAKCKPDPTVKRLYEAMREKVGKPVFDCDSLLYFASMAMVCSTTSRIFSTD